MTTLERQECIKLMGAIQRTWVMYRATEDYETFEEGMEGIIGRLNEMLWGDHYND